MPTYYFIINFGFLLGNTGSIVENRSGMLRWARSLKEKTARDCGFLKCPRLDSNQHVLTNTTPSRWRVYQFHHVGG